MFKRILKEFLLITDVQSAAVSGLDGFVIEIEKASDIDTDAVGAMTSAGIRIYEKMGRELGKGRFKQAVLSHRDGQVVLCPLTDEEFLVIMTKPGANTGHLIRELQKQKSRLLAVM